MIQPDQQVQTLTSRVICKQKDTKELAGNFFQEWLVILVTQTAKSMLVFLKN